MGVLLRGAQKKFLCLKMGQKVTPIGFRLGITYKPQSQWFVDPRSGSMKKVYPPLILEDRFIRDFITQKFPRTAIAQILIYRTLDYIKIEIHTAQAKKLSYQSTAFKSSQKALSSSIHQSAAEDDNKENSTQLKSDQNKSVTNQSEQHQTPPRNSGSSFSNLKNLQQDLQIALLKYKKTLQIFSTWKHDTFLAGNSHGPSDRRYEEIWDGAQELPKLWSYSAFPVTPHVLQETRSPLNASIERRSAIDSSIGKKNHPQQIKQESQLEQINNESRMISSDQDKSETTESVSPDQIADEDFDFSTYTELEERNKVTQPIGIVVKQLNQPFQYASIFAKYLVSQLERRENSVKQALNRSLRLIQNYNIQGIKIKVSGRLNGVDMAEQENVLKGRIPLSTIQANIDYYQDTAQTLYGTLGVKVFIYR